MTKDIKLRQIISEMEQLALHYAEKAETEKASRYLDQEMIRSYKLMHIVYQRVANALKNAFPEQG